MITDREKEICDRLRRFREILQISRTKFALSVGISSERLYTYESGKAQIRYDTFAAIQRKFSLNPVWLATGQELPRLENFSDASFRAQVKPRELFTSVYDRLLEFHLTGDRLNKSGSEHLLSVAAQYSDPQTLARMKKARVFAGVPLKMLAAVASAAFGVEIKERDLAAIESGKQPAQNQVWLAYWLDELRINQEWVESGSGEMFTVPFGKEARPLSLIKKARQAAGMSLDAVAASLARASTARVTPAELGSMESGKMLLTKSVGNGLQALLGISDQHLYPTATGKAADGKDLLKEKLEKTRAAMTELSSRFAELEKQILKS